MREIKFRGIDCSGQWVYGDLIHKRHDKEAVLIQDYTGLGSDVDITTIGQYTGLKDKNDKEIYEGDIIHIKEFVNEAIYVDFSSDDIRTLSLDDCKGRLLQEYKCIISFIDGNMIAKMISKGDCDFYISSLFGDMRYSQPIFEFEIIGNIYDTPELIKEE